MASVGCEKEDAMTQPVLNPFGEPGVHGNNPTLHGKELTCKEEKQ